MTNRYLYHLDISCGGEDFALFVVAPNEEEALEYWFAHYNEQEADEGEIFERSGEMDRESRIWRVMPVSPTEPLGPIEWGNLAEFNAVEFIAEKFGD